MHGTFTADENIKKAIRTCCIKAGLPFFLSCLIQEIRKRSSMSICIIQTVCVQPPGCFHGFLMRPFFLTERGIDHAQVLPNACILKSAPIRVLPISQRFITRRKVFLKHRLSIYFDASVSIP